ncbi:MAG: hypothetical protein U0T73_10670 [Chitinophagales bacterium]
MNKYIFSAVLIVLLQSCAKDISHAVSPTITRKGNFITYSELAGKQETWKRVFESKDGSFTFHYAEGYWALEHSVKSNTAAQGRIVNAGKNGLIPIDGIKLNAIYYPSIEDEGQKLLEVHPKWGSVEEEQISTAFGKVNHIDVLGKDVDLTCDLDFPKLLHIENFSKVNPDGWYIINKGEDLDLHWNASNNELGIFIKLEDVENYETSMPVYLFIAEDDGHFTVSADMLKPYSTDKGTTLRATLYRGAYKDVDNKMSCRFSAISESTLNIILK